MHRIWILLGLGIFVSAKAAGVEDQPLTCIQADSQTGTSLAVIVEDLPLVHTSQMLPEKVGGSTRAEADQVLMALDWTLKSANTSLDRACKLNVYLEPEAARPAVQQALAARFSGGNKPAVTFVVGSFKRAEALVAMDAVALGTEKSVLESKPENGIRPFAVLPKGPKIYVSGMADTNALPEATRRTLEKLTAAIGHLRVGKKDIVQVKAFLQPMSDVDFVRKEIVNFFEGDAPPVVLVEWISPKPNPPIEIELIASAKGDLTKADDAVSFLTPPGTTDTKVFRRVARINHGRQIYISGQYGQTPGNGGAQISEIYDRLKVILQQTGSDFEHLVKATYYISDDESSNQLNEIRPRFYKPDRAPAASKARVKGVGFADKAITVDMIAVPK